MGMRRIERATSRTAEMTCLSRAASSLERCSQLHSNDYLAMALLPGLFRLLVHLSLFRRFHRRVLAPSGAYRVCDCPNKVYRQDFRTGHGSVF